MRKIGHLEIKDRGKDKIFLIREMPALHFETWLMGAGTILSGKPDELFATADTLSRQGITALLRTDYETLRPVLAALLGCCSLHEDGREIPLVLDDIDQCVDDVRCLFLLRRACLELHLRFLGERHPLLLPKEAAFRRALKANTYARPANVPAVAGAVIDQGMASLGELEEHYSFEDALDMLELLNVRNYNHWAANEAAKQGR